MDVYVLPQWDVMGAGTEPVAHHHHQCVTLCIVAPGPTASQIFYLLLMHSRGHCAHCLVLSCVQYPWQFGMEGRKRTVKPKPQVTKDVVLVEQIITMIRLVICWRPLLIQMTLIIHAFRCVCLGDKNILWVAIAQILRTRTLYKVKCLSLCIACIIAGNQCSYTMCFNC